MSDFFDAIKVGIKNAQSAEVAVREIDAVFDQLDDSVRRSTDGKVRVRMEKNTLVNALAAFSKDAGSEIAFNVYLTASQDPSMRFLMATVTRATNGYPIQLVHERAVISVKDAAGLKSAISNVLTSTDVGRSILNLISTPQLKKPPGPVTKQTVLKRPGPSK